MWSYDEHDSRDIVHLMSFFWKFNSSHKPLKNRINLQILLVISHIGKESELKWTDTTQKKQNRWSFWSFKGEKITQKKKTDKRKTAVLRFDC